MSPENLFNILPDGFLSKYKLIGALNILFSISLWRNLAALTDVKVIIKNIKVIHNENPTGKNSQYQKYFQKSL